MPAFAANNTSGAQTRAIQIAHLNTYDHNGSDTWVSAGPVAGQPNQFQVTITKTHPTFFAGVFGMAPRSISATTIGLKTGIGGTAAIHAQNAGCGAPTWGLGFYKDGNAQLNVNGDIHGNGQIFLGPGPATGGTITGTVSTPCAPESSSYNADVNTITGGQVTVAPYVTDPINVAVGTLDASCTFPMSVNTPFNAAELTWTPGAGCDTPADKVYCGSTDIIFSPPTSMALCPGSKATFITRGRIIVGANDQIALQPATGAPNNLIFASYDASGGGPGACGAAALDMGAAGTFDMTGVIYAPNGCVKIAGGGGSPGYPGGFRLTGQLVGWNIELGTSPGPGWFFTGPAGGGGSWKILR
jgi:hypothetical protein